MDEILTPIFDPYWSYFTENGELLETFHFGRFNFQFYHITQQHGWVRFKYRMFCFVPKYTAPILSIDLEYTSRRAYFLGLREDDGHLNCGRVEKSMTYDEFRDWAYPLALERLERARKIRRIAKSAYSLRLFFGDH